MTFLSVSFRVYLWLMLIAVCCPVSLGQSAVRDYRRAHERQILAEFTHLLSIPNVASDRVNVRRSAQFIIQMMQRRGLSPRLLETKSKESPPAVYGEWKIPGATQTIVVYAHYDGQPVDPKAWTASPPWQPTWRTAALEKGGKDRDAAPPRAARSIRSGVCMRARLRMTKRAWWQFSPRSML